MHRSYANHAMNDLRMLIKIFIVTFELVNETNKHAL